MTTCRHESERPSSHGARHRREKRKTPASSGAPGCAIAIEITRHDRCPANETKNRFRGRRRCSACEHMSTPGETLLVLEGRLAGPWVEELARCWARLRDEKHAGPIRVDLDGVTFVSAAGKALLARLHDDGAVLTARACMTSATIEEIAIGGRDDRAKENEVNDANVETNRERISQIRSPDRDRRRGARIERLSVSRRRPHRRSLEVLVAEGLPARRADLLGGGRDDGGIRQCAGAAPRAGLPPPADVRGRRFGESGRSPLRDRRPRIPSGARRSARQSRARTGDAQEIRARRRALHAARKRKAPSARKSSTTRSRLRAALRRRSMPPRPRSRPRG